MRNGTIILPVTYPIRFGFVTFYLKRKIGFSFNQRALFNLLQNNEIDLKNYKEWMESKGRALVMFETMFAGAQSYRQELRRKDNFTKKGLSLALAYAGDNTVNEILECWKQSEQLGYKRITGKKKLVKQ
jgi:hypothetical protein